MGNYPSDFALPINPREAFIEVLTAEMGSPIDHGGLSTNGGSAYGVQLDKGKGRATSQNDDDTSTRSILDAETPKKPPINLVEVSILLYQFLYYSNFGLYRSIQNRLRAYMKATRPTQVSTRTIRILSLSLYVTTSALRSWSPTRPPPLQVPNRFTGTVLSPNQAVNSIKKPKATVTPRTLPSQLYHPRHPHRLWRKMLQRYFRRSVPQRPPTQSFRITSEI